MSRYIDADEFIQWFKNVWDLESEWTNEIKTITALKQTIRDIENQPTADVREVVRGEWVYKPMKGQFCSVCNEQSIWKYNYCPNCGAEMRGEK